MSHQALSSFIWSVADLLRGAYKQSEYGKVILPFTILRRLDCVLETTKKAVLSELAAKTVQGLNPDLSQAILHAITNALDAHTTMNIQALNSQKIQDGLKDTLLGPAQLYVALRERSQPRSISG